MASDAEMVRDPWREAIERWFIGWHRLPDWNADPWPQINAMIAWEQSAALDPEVSEKARALIAAARAEGMEAAAKVADDIHHAHARAEREARAAQDYGRSELLSAMAIGSSAAGAAIRGGSHGE